MSKLLTYNKYIGKLHQLLKKNWLIFDKIIVINNVKSLRGHEDFFLLDVPPVPNLTRTERSFTYCAPQVWNGLPYELRSCPNVDMFKNKLKTFLFVKAFGDS